jgi:hexosaminidase
MLIIDKNNQDWNKEEYELQINRNQIKITANHQEGVIRGIQTLRQVFPALIESETIQSSKWNIPSGTIHDYPKYKYRGAMLDVSRHFFTVDEVKRYIDLIALYKINHLHMHLSDDQGWRIEIKSWPKLTKIGGYSSVNNEKPGFYSQEDYTELINYAQQRFVTIVPEIDLPGHTNAALASYAELNENNKTTELYSGIKVGFSSLAIQKEITYVFIDDVIRELASLTPGPYIHIGGDESHSTNHDDYIYFMNKTLNIVSKYNKKALGWDEIAHANVNENHTVQFWSNKKNTALGLKKGTKVIFSPAKYAYLDMKYDSTTTLGLMWAGTTEVDKTYNWLPDTIIQNINPQQILGVEAPLWSETIKTNADIEYLAFPRICGIAEIGWSQNNTLNWEEYKTRLAKQKERFEILGINFYESTVVEWELPEDK